MRQILIIIILAGAKFSYAQNASKVIDPKQAETELYNKSLSQKNSILELNLSSFGREQIGNLNNEIIGYKEKVVSVNYDQNTKIMTIIHNSLIGKEDMYEILKKHGIMNNQIINYQ